MLSTAAVASWRFVVVVVVVAAGASNIGVSVAMGGSCFGGGVEEFVAAVRSM